VNKKERETRGRGKDSSIERKVVKNFDVRRKKKLDLLSLSLTFDLVLLLLLRGGGGGRRGALALLSFLKHDTMLTRTASPRIARGAAAAAAAALKNKGAAATPPPRVFLLLPRAPTAAMMPSMMPQHHHHHLRPPPAASLPRALPVSCAYLGRDFVPWPSARR
jgi:hypothetical protein